MVWSNNTAINNSSGLVVVDPVGEFISHVGAAANKISSAFFRLGESINMIKKQDLLPENELEESRYITGNSIPCCNWDTFAFVIPRVVMNIGKIQSS